MQYTINPKTVTEFKMHEGPEVTFLVLEGKCIFETVYRNDKISIEKSMNQSYTIKEKVEYRLQNTCNSPCILLIM